MNLTDVHTRRGFLLEVFILFNVAFLILDVYLAHAVNEFAHWGEWVPIYFAAAGTLALGVAVHQEWKYENGHSRWLGNLVGWGAIIVGLLGMIWHLEAWFLEAVTIRSLVYSAPFVAPLAFAGLGFLLLMNRRVARASIEWGQWVVFFAWGGFVGNFALSLIDHAQNGFFYWTEWIPVVVSALAVGYMFALIVRPASEGYLKLGYAVMGLQALTGVLGFLLHVWPLWTATAETFFQDMVYGAPVFAPLLFADLALLGALGVWDLQAKSTSRELAAA
jgi:hypothetical protein